MPDSESIGVGIPAGLVIEAVVGITTATWVIIVCVEIPEMTVAIVMTCVVVESGAKLEGFAGEGSAGEGFGAGEFATGEFATGEFAAGFVAGGFAGGEGFGEEGGELVSTERSV